jgi:hypothetical protein
MFIYSLGYEQFMNYVGTLTGSSYNSVNVHFTFLQYYSIIKDDANIIELFQYSILNINIIIILIYFKKLRIYLAPL